MNGTDTANIISLERLLTKPDSDPPLVRFRDGEFVLDANGFEYAVDAGRADTAEKLLDWIFHLSEKTWCSCGHIRELIELAERRGGGKTPVTARAGNRGVRPPSRIARKTAASAPQSKVVSLGYIGTPPDIPSA